MQAQLNEFIRHVDTFMKKISGTSISDAMRLLPEPLTTKKAVDELESKVASNLAHRQALVRMLSSLHKS